MRGHLYACDWLEDADYGNMMAVTSRTRALWVPEVGILIQWVLPEGRIQVSLPKEFPPPADEARVASLGDRTVPYTVVQEARRYLESQERHHAQQETIQRALDRITNAAIRSEDRLQAVASKFFLRDKPAGEARATK